MKKYSIYGMSCASCASSIERAVKAVGGVTECTVSLLTNSMTVAGNAESKDIIAAVKKAGYDAHLFGSEKSESIPQSKNDNMAVRLVVSIVFLLLLMYISMGHAMWGFPLPGFLSGNHLLLALLQLVFCGVIMVANQKFFINGFKGALHASPNMDTLVALGAAAAFIYSLTIVFIMTLPDVVSDHARSADYMHNLYFESAGMILTLVTVGKLLEERSKGKTADAVKSLAQLTPKTVSIIKNGSEITVDSDSVRVGDVFIVRPGESVAADGVIIEGATSVDESMLTGESIPVDKQVNDSVTSGTINKSGVIRCRVTATGEDTAISKIIKTVTEAAAGKPPIARIADRVSSVFVPFVIAVSIITFIAWIFAGKEFSFALARAISVLVISCPCALGLATPVAVMVSSGVGAKNGILFKNASSIEHAGKAKTVLFDKTGTLTEGKPSVTDVIPLNGTETDELVSSAYSLEINSNHPLAASICKYAKAAGASLLAVSDFKEMPGSGVYGVLNRSQLFALSLAAASEKFAVSSEISDKASLLSKEGKSPILFIRDGVLIGILALSDSLKPDSAAAVSYLKKMNIETVMLTGDNAMTASYIAKKLGINRVISGVLPEGKAEAVQSFRSKGTVIMVGDGINDAPALTAADVGIAIGTGTDIAIESADAVVMKNSLFDVVNAVRLSRAALKNIKVNLFWAFFYNVIGIPLAAGIFIPLLGWELNPMFAAAAMSLSSISVVLNALSLNFFRPKYDNNSLNSDERKDVVMKKTMKIKGMMCSHCESHVKNALEAIDGVTVLSVSSKSGTAEISISQNISDSQLTEAVRSAGYDIISID